MSAADNGRFGGQFSRTTPTALQCDSPKVDILNIWPNDDISR